MIKIIFSLLILILGFSSCARVSVDKFTDKAYPPTNYVEVLRLSDEVPTELKEIGKIYVGDLGGLTIQCGYELQLNRLKKKAKSLGANSLVITEELKPDFISYCYGIHATLYR